MPAGSPSLVDTGNGLTIRYLGRNLYSPISPIAAAERRAASYTIPAQTLLFVPSPLFFYGIDQLLARLPEEVHLLCVEVDQQLMHLSSTHTAKSILNDRRVTYIRTDSVDSLLQALHELSLASYRRCREVVVNAGRSVNRERYRRMFEAVEYEIQSYWRNRMTLMHMAHLWIKNFFVNLPFVVEGEDLAAVEISKPIVVAGAGESLETAMELLAPLREDFYLLAVDTALHSLVEYGLEPDAAVVLDAQSANFQDLVGVDTAGIDLIADVTAYPNCIRRFFGRRAFFFSEFAPTHLFSRARAAGLLPTGIPPLGSVGVAALYCALLVTREPVMFAGLDFSYRPGKSHARGAPAHVASLLRSGRLSPETMYGQTVERPHRVTTDKSGRAVWTDNLLQGYSSAMEFFVAERPRVYDVGTTGLSTGAPRLSDRDTIRKVLRSAVPASGDARRRRPAANFPAQSKGHLAKRDEVARRFLEEERRLIATTVEKVVKALGSGRIGDPAAAQLRAAVNELDYTFLHFPDWSEEPPLTEGFLKRFVEAAETSAVWIERTLARLGEPREP